MQVPEEECKYDVVQLPAKLNDNPPKGSLVIGFPSMQSYTQQSDISYSMERLTYEDIAEKASIEKDVTVQPMAQPIGIICAIWTEIININFF